MAKRHARGGSKGNSHVDHKSKSQSSRRARQTPAAAAIACVAFLVLSVVFGIVAIALRSQLVAWVTPTLSWLPLAAAVCGLILLPEVKQLRIAAIISDESSVAAAFRVDVATLQRHMTPAGNGLLYLSIPPGTFGQ